jgi:hypothetical protein
MWPTSNLSQYSGTPKHETDSMQRARTSYVKKRLFGRNFDSVSSASQIAPSQPDNFANPNDDKASIITLGRLRKFNDINGYENGPAVNLDPDEGEAEEQMDTVLSLAASRLRAKRLLDG